MDTSLQTANLVIDDADASHEITESAEEQEHHIHMPNPSWWPLLLSIAILVAVIGLLFIPDAPYLTIIAVPFILVGILGWALENPMGHSDVHEAERSYIPSLTTQAVLDRAHEAVEKTVTFGSTAYSTHPIKIDVEEDIPGKGVILTLNGKVELNTQREEVEAAVRQVPNVIDVRNFVVAEDNILNMAYSRIENMKAQGKLDGAQGVSVLVENYILHIYGDVPNSKMKYALERELIGIPGVRVVVNHIGLNTDIPGNLGKTANKI